MKIQKEFDPIQGTTTVRIEKTREIWRLVVMKIMLCYLY